MTAASKPIKFITGFESARFMPPHRTDILATSNHLRFFREDLALVRDALQEYGLEPIVDLVHHVSIPTWIKRGFANPD